MRKMLQTWSGRLLIVIAVFTAVNNLREAAAADNTSPAATSKTTAKESSATKEAASEKPATSTKKAEKKFAGRLPIYYGDVVTADQKEKIYAIQAGYADKLSALVEQVKAIQAQQAAEIEAVLTPEQKKQIDALREAAAAKRKMRAAANATVGETKTAAGEAKPAEK